MEAAPAAEGVLESDDGPELWGSESEIDGLVDRWVEWSNKLAAMRKVCPYCAH